MNDPVGLVPKVFTIMGCASCGGQFVDPMPGPDDVDPFFEVYWGAGDGGSASLAARFEGAYKDFLNWSELVRLKRWIRPGCRVLDIGCGGGDALWFLQKWGCDCSGLESTEAGVAATRRRVPGVDARVGDVYSNDFPDHAFDLILMSHVIEHLPRPAEALERVRRLLKPDGMLCLMLPSIHCLQRHVFGARWFVYHPPRHLVYYTPSALGRLLGRCGFEPVRIHHVALKHGPAILVNSLFPRMQPFYMRRWTGAVGLGARALYLLLVIGLSPIPLFESLLRRSPTLMVLSRIAP